MTRTNSIDMAEAALITRRQSSSPEGVREEVPGVPLGAIVGITLGSGLVLFLILGFGLIWLGKRRAAQRRDTFEARGLVLEEDVDEERVGSPNKLRKRDMSETMLGERSSSPMQRIPLPVLPAIALRRTSFNSFFGSMGAASKRLGGGDAGGSPRRGNSNWIDADAIHGPKVKKHKETGGKKLLRDSWPLKAMVPTLPRLHQHTESHHSQKGEHLFVEPGKVRSLPQPPRPILGDFQRPVTQASHPRQNSHYEGGGHDENYRRLSTGRGRQSSTDSTLSQILAKTEMRLEQGTITGVARRNRAAASSVKKWTMGSTINKSMENIGEGRLVGRDDDHDEKTVGSGRHKESGSRTPSPAKSGKSQPSTPYQHHQHGHKVSISSDFSEPESIYGLAAITNVDDADAMAGLVMGLGSPSRSPLRQQNRSSVTSPTNSISSSLSTVYSEDEKSNNDNITQVTSHPSSSVSDDVDKTTASDPFYVDASTVAGAHRTPPSCSPQGSPRVGNVRVSVVGVPKLVLNRPPRLQSSSSSSPDRQELSRPLSKISPNGSPRPKSSSGPSSMGSPSAKTNFIPTRQRPGIFPAPVLRHESSTGDNQDRAATPPKPTVLITSPSTLSSRRSLFGLDRLNHEDIDSPSVGRTVPPHLDLRVENLDRTWSPTLGFEEDDYVSIVTPSPLPSPGIPSPSETISLAQEPLIETRGYKKVDRVVSTTSSIYSQYTDITSLDKTIPQCQPAHPPLPETAKTIAGRQVWDGKTVTITKQRVVPPPSSLNIRPSEKSSLLLSEASIAEGNKKFLITGAIAELRRMNSQVSAYSNSSSQPSTAANNGPASPTLPQLRGGGFSPSARPAGAKNYLSLAEAAASNERDEVGPQQLNLSSPVQSLHSIVIPPPGCAMSIWGGCEDRQSSCSPPAQPWSDGYKDARIVQLKMPKLDFDRFSGSFGAEVSERFIKDFGSLEKRDSRHESMTEIPPRFPVGYQRNIQARSANLAMQETAGSSGDRRSIDSLGLYDQDGFLIASPDRIRFSAAARTRGLRV